MPYAKKVVSEPAGGEPVAAAAIVTALTAFIVQKTGLDHSSVEWLVIGVVGIVSTFLARRNVKPVPKA